METGVDELIESLLIEIAFSGVRGCSVSALLKAIESFYDNVHEEIGSPAGPYLGGKESRKDVNCGTSIIGNANHTQQNVAASNLSVGSKVWGWLVARVDVSVGDNRQFNHLTLDEILSLPEEEEGEEDLSAAATNAKQSKKPTTTSAKVHQRPPRNLQESRDVSQTHRPRLHVSEERQWKALAGHNPDLKRIPLYEWKALVDIASMREKGILQGDLVRMTGQDKRSLPMRTEALAKKGYIIKQPIILRGCRSSKLWLTQFAEHAKVNQDGLRFDKIDLSKETLTRDLRPVPFSDSWNGEKLDYIAIAQAFNAVVKAWGLMRYCDIRSKLDANRVPQMRALAKTSRWFTSIGAVTFVAARFANGQRLFKDCVKFIREPTAEEWRVFRSTPTAHIKVPSARLGKRGQASRAKFKKAKPSPHSQVKANQTTNKQRNTQLAHRDELIPSLWTPHKLMVNTTFEIIKRAGVVGSSNVEVGRHTLGHGYRKYVTALTGALSLPKSQPPHLEHFDVTSQLGRVGKALTYQFFAKSEVGNLPAGEEHADEGQNQETDTTVQDLDGDTVQKDSITPTGAHRFSEPVISKFAKASASTVSQIQNTLRTPKPKAGTKRKRGFGNKSMKDTSANSPAKRSKMSGIGASPSVEVPTAEGPTDNQEANLHEDENKDTPVTNIQQTTDVQEPPAPLPPPSPPASPPPPPPRPPGVYREPDNMLDPPGKKGRRKKSLVLTFKYDSLKPLLERMQNTQSTGSPLPADSESTATGDPKVSGVVGTAKTKAKVTKRGGRVVYHCDKCDKTFKNSNGLEYHLTKSKSTCNPDYVPPPPPPPRELFKPKPILKGKPINGSGDQAGDEILNPSQPLDTPRGLSKRNPDARDSRPLLPSKRVRISDTFIGDQNNGDLPKLDPIRGSIVLQDVEAYDVIDHRKRREHNHATSTHTNSANPPLRQASQRLSHTESTKQSKSARQSGARPPMVEKEQRMPAPVETPQEKPKRTPLPHARSQGTQGTRTDNPGIPASIHATGSLSDFNLRPSLTEPVLPLNGPHLGTVIQPAGSDVTESSHGFGAVTSQPSCASDKATQQSSFKKPRKTPAPTVGTLRKERTTQIIEYLLDNNDGVFPGLLSVYLAVVSLWVKRHSDIEPPDRKVCQNVVNTMEKAGKLVQIHFCFLDDGGKLLECRVLAKPRPGKSGIEELTVSPKVVSVKEKMREMYPEPYIPEEFSLPQEESELFDALASKFGDSPRSSTSRKPAQKPNVAEDIEVLQYPEHIMGEVPSSLAGLKRSAEDDELVIRSPTKKARVDTRDNDKPRNTPKARKRGETREYWAAGKVAKYIWNQKQNQGEKWNQKPACLQDFETGTWAVPPQEIIPARPDIDKILSSVQTQRENAFTSTQRRMRDKSKDNSRGSTEAPWLTKEDSPDDTGTKTVTIDRFVKPSLSTSFIPEDSGSEEEDDETTPDDTQDGSVIGEDSSTSPNADESSTIFPKSRTIRSTRPGCWPWLAASFFETDSASFVLDGSMPDAKWFQRENLPQSAEDIIRPLRGKFQFNSWADPLYGKFLREVNTIERWEQSPEGSQILLHGSIAPDFIFISLSSDASRANMKPNVLEWPSSTQYTAANIPDEVKNASPSDENVGLPDFVQRGRGRPKRMQDDELQRERKAKRARLTLQPEVEYKTRIFRPIPVQHRGRVSRPDTNEDSLGLSGETELIAAFVVFKTLLGGVEKKPDIGLILKTFPNFSHSALRKFWPKVSKTRKTYIDALTTKFQTAFLEAYETGEIAPINYDDLDSYDWQKLIIWTTRLETHENIDLPASRNELEGAYTIGDVVNETVDWRETWFQNLASVFSRIEATANETVSIPLSHSVSANEELISRARSWVRSLCITSIKGRSTPEEIRAKLLRLSNSNEAEANKLLKTAVDQLTSERVTARSKGKILGGALRLHGVFAKHLERAVAIDKFIQAANFKTQLDECFHKGEAFFLPYVANDGTIMAIINLQAHGRIRVDAIDTPNIPFGFEPGNYDGRTFPKSYYHFKVKLSPTESYMFDKDLPVLHQVTRIEAPQQGSQEMIPIWVDFFGRLDKVRWVTYLSMVALALATKGPLTPESSSVLLKPFVEPFEAKLIIDWIDGLGLLEHVESAQSATVGEWWWLAVGRVGVETLRKETPQGLIT
ncbi:hypothetical protein F5Y04DRAFT_92564 [Hypomontagnella monticulosa]|nr:hypothetical protein F5Y04DRAFT_92564 [Hypomontagnella monticulosa]